MGFLDKLRGTNSASDDNLSEREGFVGILLATIAADGHFSDDENRAFVAVVNRMALYRKQTGVEFNAMVERVLGMCNRRGVDWLLQASAAALSPELRETAFAVATDLVLADGVVSDTEVQRLDVLKSHLGVSEELAEKGMSQPLLN